MSRLVAIYSPAARMGKTTIAHQLVNHGWYLIKLAGPLKAMVRAMLEPVVYDVDAYIEGDLKNCPISDLNGLSARQLMQTLGTEWGRALYEDIWIDAAMTKIHKLLNQGHSVVVDDMRFPNEYFALKKAGAELVRVFRPGIPIDKTHLSEARLELKEFDLYIDNSKSLEWVQALARKCLIPEASRDCHPSVTLPPGYSH